MTFSWFIISIWVQISRMWLQAKLTHGEGPFLWNKRALQLFKKFPDFIAHERSLIYSREFATFHILSLLNPVHAWLRLALWHALTDPSTNTSPSFCFPHQNSNNRKCISVFLCIRHVMPTLCSSLFVSLITFYDHFPFLRSFQRIRQVRNRDWNTAPCLFSAATYSIHSQLNILQDKVMRRDLLTATEEEFTLVSRPGRTMFPEVDLVSSRNEYQELSPGVKGGRNFGLTT